MMIVLNYSKTINPAIEPLCLDSPHPVHCLPSPVSRHQRSRPSSTVHCPPSIVGSPPSIFNIQLSTDGHLILRKLNSKNKSEQILLPPIYTHLLIVRPTYRAPEHEKAPLESLLLRIVPKQLPVRFFSDLRSPPSPVSRPPSAVHCQSSIINRPATTFKRANVP